MTDRTGLYGLFNLDGAPLDPRDAAVLTLAPPETGASGAAQAVDLADSAAVHEDRSGNVLTLLLGRIGDASQVAARLGMTADATQAMLAREALHRFGGDIRHIMPGEWTLLHRDGARVVLASSLAQRDPLLYAQRGMRLALGPDLRQLSRLAWVDDDLDTAGLLFSFGRQHLRGAMADRTVLARVHALGAGGFITFDGAHREVAPPALLAPAPRWHGSFADAMAETEALLMRIVGERMWSDRIGCLLSGGLDSSTLTWLVARNRQTQALRCFTSAAPPGSGLADETDAAGIVADHLGLPMDRIVPDAAANAYRPGAGLFREWNGPGLSPRHYLYQAFADRAGELQIPLLFDGQFGEFTITNPYPLASMPERLREAVRRWRGHRTRFPEKPLGGAYHVFAAPGVSAAPPGPVAAALASPIRRVRMPAPGEAWGLLPGFDKSLKAPASMALGRLRIAQPFRDPRLLSFVSGLPASLLQTPPHDRAPARHILTGHLPDSIRLRPKGLHISPDYRQRLIGHAPLTQARIAVFRRAGADEWLDLDMLDAALADVANGALQDLHKMLQVQLTAQAAEFVTWWRGIS